MLILNAVNGIESNWVIGAIRSVLWMLAKGVLLLLDGMFVIIDEVWRFKFFDNEYVNTLFGGAIILASTWICLKVMIEFVVNHMINSEQQGPSAIIKGIVIALSVMFLINPLFDLGHKFSVGLTDSVIKVTGMSSKTDSLESSISRSIIKSMSNNSAMTNEDREYFLLNWKSEDINKTKDNGLLEKDTYKYDFNLFMMIIVGILVLFLLFFVGIQMAKRVVELALYKIIAPMVATSLTNPKSKSFDTWLKGAIALFLVTAIQFICLGLLINVFSSSMDNSNNLFTGILLLVGALLFVISSPSIISSLLGENIGAMSAYSDMQSAVLMSSGVSMGLGVAKSGVMGTLAMGSKVVSSVPKVGGKVSGMIEQFNNLKNNGSSSLGALGKTVANQAFSPITNPIASKINNFKDVYNNSKNIAANRQIIPKVNPINFDGQGSDNK